MHPPRSLALFFDIAISSHMAITGWKRGATEVICLVLEMLGNFNPRELVSPTYGNSLLFCMFLTGPYRLLAVWT